MTCQLLEHTSKTLEPDPLGSVLMVPDPSIVGSDNDTANENKEKDKIQMDTPNQDSEVGSPDDITNVLPVLSPTKRAPTPVVTNRSIDSTLFPLFCPIEEMTGPLSIESDIQKQMMLGELATVKPGKGGQKCVLGAVAKMVSLLFNI